MAKRLDSDTLQDGDPRLPVMINEPSQAQLNHGDPRLTQSLRR